MFNCLMPLTEDTCKFVEWAVQQEDWFYNSITKSWEKFNHADKTTQGLFEFWQKESGNGE